MVGSRTSGASDDRQLAQPTDVGIDRLDAVGAKELREARAW